MATDIHKADFLGKGWQFPPQFSKETATVIITENETDINNSLQVLLTTAITERIMQPRYGCDARKWIFESMDTGTQTLMRDTIETAILYYEPRIEVLGLDFSAEKITEGLIAIIIEYKIKATNSRFNFVFPYYLHEGSEINFNTQHQPVLL
ncbi:MAG: GPW/gp25 family protein [Niabella sp.]